MKIEQIGNTIVIYNTNEKTKYPHSIYTLSYGNDNSIKALKEMELAKQKRIEEKQRRLYENIHKKCMG